jgi:hypothetical protein
MRVEEPLIGIFGKSHSTFGTESKDFETNPRRGLTGCAFSETNPIWKLKTNFAKRTRDGLKC